MANKIVGKEALQEAIKQTKKLIHSEVAIGTDVPLDENIQLFVKEDEEGTSPNDFYTKAEVDKIKADLLDTINNIHGFKLIEQGEVADPANYPISGGTGGYAAQAVTLNSSKLESGVFIVDCKTEHNPETVSYVGSCWNTYISSLSYLGGSKNSGYIKVEQLNPTAIKITNSSPGCGKVYYNIWLLPFAKPNS